MKTDTVKCPGCGAVMDINLSRRQAECSYCGTKVLLGDDIVKRHLEEEAKLKEAEIKLKEMQYSHERELQQEHYHQVWRRSFWISVAVYVGVLAFLYTTRGPEGAFSVIFLFGGIALIAMNVSIKRGFSKEQVYGRSQKDWLTTLLLCIFVGGLGIHRFYVGRIAGGILFLFTFGLFGIGWFLDLIRIICGRFKDSDGYYVQM